MDKKVIALKGIRKIIAERMRKSLDTAAQANHRLRADATEMIKLKDELKSRGIKISITDILLKPVAIALIENPIMNATLTEEGIVFNEEINIGVAVAVSNGLIVPVIKGVDKLTLREIGERAFELVERTRSGKLKPDDISGGTFTVTNLGMYGIENFTAIINTPETGILAVGAIVKTPVVNEKDEIVIKPMMELSLTYDHRVVDGAPAAEFLLAVKKYIESPKFDN